MSGDSRKPTSNPPAAYRACPQPPSLPERLQDLAPAQAHFCLRILRGMEKTLGRPLKGSALFAAFSGGADSTALLLALRWLRPKAGFTLQALHLDHGLRPSSATEAEYCRRFCSGLGLECGVRSLNLKNEGVRGVEERARKARYAFFAEKTAETPDSLIALGHNGNDLAEDILMRLIRGAGWPGLSGMRAYDRQRALIRPLLGIPRTRIEGFLADLGIVWLRDESNLDRAFLRNRVRLDILPLILRENPSFLEAAAGLRLLGGADEEYFAALLADAAPQAPGREIFISGQRLAGLHKALRLRLYKKILDALGPGQARLATLLEADAAWLAGGEPTEHLLPGGKKIRIGKKGLSFFAAGEIP
ncbi:MAG: tRNA lysidine(34) synthetase TilS [Desulfovibrio sp.]|jgi:tRNA(Ile)-lysidine synthase|nr:tRNA lysidine(34) synthetase TilS [Desulfovibrio sp.]